MTQIIILPPKQTAEEWAVSEGWNNSIWILYFVTGSLSSAAGFGPTRDSGRVKFWWQSPALADYFSCQSYRLCDLNERSPISNHTAAHLSFPGHHLLQQGSTQPLLSWTRLFSIIIAAKRLEFSRGSVTTSGLDSMRSLMFALQEYISSSAAILTVRG